MGKKHVFFTLCLIPPLAAILEIIFQKSGWTTILHLFIVHTHFTNRCNVTNDTISASILKLIYIDFHTYLAYKEIDTYRIGVKSLPISIRNASISIRYIPFYQSISFRYKFRYRIDIDRCKVVAKSMPILYRNL